MTAEGKRLEEARENVLPWKKWGPYLSERQWGTVREDYSESGDAWNSNRRHARRTGGAGMRRIATAAVLR